ncbi:hypothetical protein, partial [Microcoleus sp. herbarium5]|uniref:hypothetical protein n=1 Tax=Microcoleus sp. herbarium5 TaxID=3055434 RepID=UPI002FD44146
APDEVRSKCLDLSSICIAAKTQHENSKIHNPNLCYSAEYVKKISKILRLVAKPRRLLPPQRQEW